ncbi:MAG TPA: GAF domain-containing protein [Acidobacteria bacterium]|nr:GAF domain-containing protein [Acidobacteriota bacterium]
MALEEKVQRSSEELLERIREQIEQEVRGLVSEMLTIAAKERATAAELAAVPVLSAPEPTPVESHTDEVLGRLLDGVRRLDKASRLTDVLNTLAELAGNETPRAAVLTVQADRVRGWRFVGFGPTLDEDEARQVDLAFGEAGIVGRAVVTGDACSVVSGPNGVPRDAEPAFTTLPLGVHALAVPVLVGGQVMAVVYGDDAERRPAAAWRESLEVLARHAGHCLEALTALRAAQLALQDVESFFPENAGPTLPFDEGGVERPKPEADEPSLRPSPRERGS